MRFSKTFLLLLIATAAGTVWTVQHGRANQLRHLVATAEARELELREHAFQTAEEVNQTQQALAAEKPRFHQAVREMAAADRKLQEKHPDSRWAVAPAELPEWNAESPYVWLRKETLPRLPAPVFTRTGELRPEVASVLTLTGAQQSELNKALRACLDRYHALETTKVERLQEPLPGIGTEVGEKVTIRVTPMPEEGARAKAEFENALRDSMGDQRAELILQLADSWIDQQFSQGGQQPKTITVVRKPDGGFSIAIRSGGSWLSTGVGKEYAEQLDEYIPPHLAPFFKELRD